MKTALSAQALSCWYCLQLRRNLVLEGNIYHQIDSIFEITNLTERPRLGPFALIHHGDLSLLPCFCICASLSPDCAPPPHKYHSYSYQHPFGWIFVFWTALLGPYWRGRIAGSPYQWSWAGRGKEARIQGTAVCIIFHQLPMHWPGQYNLICSKKAYQQFWWYYNVAYDRITCLIRQVPYKALSIFLT